MSIEHSAAAGAHSSHLRTYVTGFALSLILTGLAFYLVGHQGFNRTFVLGSIIILALVQLFVQLFFFLHLNSEQGPRWKLLTFGFMAGVLLIVVVGSLWIMNNLNYNMMSPEQLDKTISQGENIGL